VVSKAFSMFKNNAAVDIFLFQLRVTWSISLIHRSVVLWRARKTNLLALSRHLSPMCFWIILGMTSSNNLPVAEKRKSDVNFEEILGPYRGSVTL
jgi:hypothetical protein